MEGGSEVTSTLLGLAPRFVVVFGAYWDETGQPAHLDPKQWPIFDCDEYEDALIAGTTQIHKQVLDPHSRGVTVYFTVEKRYEI